MYQQSVRELFNVEWQPAADSLSNAKPKLQYKPISTDLLLNSTSVTSRIQPTSTVPEAPLSGPSNTPAKPTAATATPSASGSSGRYVPPHLRNANISAEKAACIPGLLATPVPPDAKGKKGQASLGPGASNKLHEDYELPSHLRAHNDGQSGSADAASDGGTTKAKSKKKRHKHKVLPLIIILFTL